MSKKWLLFFISLCFISYSYADNIPDGFVYLKGGTFQPGSNNIKADWPKARLLPFEILDHTVTNREYMCFTEATGYKTPQHWVGGNIPSGFEEYPVIYVDRVDVREYLRWLSKLDGRIYRLPTRIEFQYASRGGLTDKVYPWGDDAPDEHANFDKTGNRVFTEWKTNLKPSRWGEKNGFGLYNMSGNVWHLTYSNHDLAVKDNLYRVDDPEILEQSIMGSSWARSAEYLQCGFVHGLPPGIAFPDVGFRPVRMPRGDDWEIVSRKLSCVTVADNQLLLSWAMLDGDKQSDGFNVYRADNRMHAGFKLNNSPITNATSFVDKNVQVGQRYQYYVKPVKNGKEGHSSEWLGCTVLETPSPIVTSFSPIYKKGGFVPVFGDIDGDGLFDCAVRLNNGNSETSQDPGVPVQMEAFTSYGRSLWRKDICYHDHCYGNAYNVPFNVWDMDGDGKAEIITYLQIDDSVVVAILNGITGQVKHKTRWPEMVSDTQKSSTRIHMAIAYLDGNTPAVITQTGLYENEVISAFDNHLNKLWEFTSSGATNGSGSHKIEVADVDGDGTQEIFDGTTCLNTDGTVRWSIYRQHPDIVSIHDHLPERPGLEVFYIVESSMHAGVYMVDASTGEIIWKVNREDDPRWEHGHRGWSADFWSGSPGMECVSNRRGHSDYNYVLFSADGKVIIDPLPAIYVPIEWDGDLTKELLGTNGRTIGNFDGEKVVLLDNELPNPFPKASLVMVADLYGDFRDELVLNMAAENGKRQIVVVSATKAIDKKFISATEVFGYSQWIGRNIGGGYPFVYTVPLRLE